MRTGVKWMKEQAKNDRLKHDESRSGLNLVMVCCIILLIGSVSFSAGYLFGAGQNNPQRCAGMTVIDDLGRNVTLNKIPERFVSLASSVTEVLFAVGLGGRVVGVDDFSDYPQEAKNITKVGSFNLNYELIVSLKPDLIVGADITSRQQISELESRGFAVMILAPKTIHGILQDIRLIGLVSGNAEKAMNLANSLSARIDAVLLKTSNASLSRPRTYLEYYPYWTFGPGSFGDDLIRMAGGSNIAMNATISYPMVNDEWVIQSDPEVIIYTVGSGTSTTNETIKARPGWSQITAVKENRIYSIDDNIVARPGPRMVDALESLAKIIHPELFR